MTSQYNKNLSPKITSILEFSTAKITYVEQFSYTLKTHIPKLHQNTNNKLNMAVLNTLFVKNNNNPNPNPTSILLCWK